MVAPNIVPRAQHPITRRNIDPDALKVLYRLHEAGHVAYLVGGGVRDLLLERRPKDFDIGTSAHPYEIKKLFRNCWIIGRRFRLAHVRFGTKVIEVATFRKQVPAGSQEEPPTPADGTDDSAGAITRDNTFGTPEEDAFRRDFTVNALFYDIGTFAILDYVGGLDDLAARVIRCIGDPDRRFPEDPVRMLRAITLASRLDFMIDGAVLDGISRHGQLLATSAPARLTEELFKILRAGAAERTFRRLAESGLFEGLVDDLHGSPPDALWHSLARLDEYRLRYASPPEQLTNAILIGSLLVPLGFSQPPVARRRTGTKRPRSPQAFLGALPLPRRDMDDLREILDVQRRLMDLTAAPRAQQVLRHRRSFEAALTWLEIHGGAPEVMAHWRASPDAAAADEPAGRRKRRRRRRRRGGAEPKRPPPDGSNE